MRRVRVQGSATGAVTLVYRICALGRISLVVMPRGDRPRAVERMKAKASPKSGASSAASPTFVQPREVRCSKAIVLVRRSRAKEGFMRRVYNSHQVTGNAARGSG